VRGSNEPESVTYVPLLFVTYVLDLYTPRTRLEGFVRSLEKSGPRANFFRIEEIDAPCVRPEGEGQGCPESKLAPFRFAQTNAAIPPDFSSLAHQVQRGLKNPRAGWHGRSPKGLPVGHFSKGRLSII